MYYVNEYEGGYQRVYTPVVGYSLDLAGTLVKHKNKDRNYANYSKNRQVYDNYSLLLFFVLFVHYEQICLVPHVRKYLDYPQKARISYRTEYLCGSVDASAALRFKTIRTFTALGVFVRKSDNEAQNIGKDAAK